MVISIPVIPEGGGERKADLYEGHREVGMSCGDLLHVLLKVVPMTKMEK